MIAYLKVPLIAVSALAIIIAVIVAQNDMTLKTLKDKIGHGVKSLGQKSTDPKQQEVDDFYA